MKRLMMTTAVLGLLVACEPFLDGDLRGDLGSGFDTSGSVTNLPDRPRPDAQGVISYPTYQVVVAKRDDTIRSVAQRVGQDADALARFNGIAVDAALRQGEVVALPERIADQPATTTPQGTDITAIAENAIERAGPQVVATTALEPTPAPVAPPVQSGTEPIRHKVARGETVFSISRLYSVPVRNIAEWNKLTSDLGIRVGQFLLIPRGDASPPVQEPVTQPGTGTLTPVPPSAAAPLPAEVPAPAATAPTVEETPDAPDLGTATQATTSTDARFAMPAQGTIIRDYAAGRNEGIDIGLAAGTAVKAADGGTVAAVTTDTSGVAIVVIKHPDNLLTVYTNLEDLSVAKGATVSRGQTLGKVRAGDPSFLHFEVRRGLQSVDPKDFLP